MEFHGEGQHVIDTAGLTGSSNTQWLTGTGFQVAEQGRLATWHPAASFTVGGMPAPSLNYASRLPTELLQQSPMVSGLATLPRDSGALLADAAHAPAAHDLHKDSNRAIQTAGVGPTHSENDSTNIIGAKVPIWYGSQGTSRGFRGALAGNGPVSVVAEADIKPPRETLSAPNPAPFPDTASNSFHPSPRFAAFCLGIDLFDAEELPQLSNCCRDANYLASCLREVVPAASSRNLVHSCDNMTKVQFERRFSRFESELAALSARSETPDLVIVFLASHGFQLDSDIYVAYSDTHIGEYVQAEPRHALKETCLDISRLICRIKLGYSGPLALILDACRTSPIPSLALHLTSLANRITYPSNTLVCFSTSAGGTAADGDGAQLQHSPFFLALMQKLTVAEVSIRSAIDAACNALSPDQGPVCVTFQFKDLCLVPRMIDLILISSPTGTQPDVARQLGLLKSAQERQNGRSDRIVLLTAREDSIPADVLALCTHAGIPRVEFPLSTDDIATIVAIWNRRSSVT
jgi:hypothetical protein